MLDLAQKLFFQLGTHYLVVDLETTKRTNGLDAAIDDDTHWPDIAQIAWAQYARDGTLLQFRNYVFQGDFAYVPGPSLSHEKEKLRVETVLKDFADLLDCARHLVSHSIAFDTKILEVAFHRRNIESCISSISTKCTKLIGTDYCQLTRVLPESGKVVSKWPSLTELHTKLFGRGFRGAHDAFNDVMACARCFFAMQHMGLAA